MVCCTAHPYRQQEAAMTDEETDAERQIQIHKEIEKIAFLEADQVANGVSGAASRGELRQRKMNLLAESEKILDRQISRVTSS
jgi:hypothetical protein